MMKYKPSRRDPKTGYIIYDKNDPNAVVWRLANYELRQMRKSIKGHQQNEPKSKEA